MTMQNHWAGERALVRPAVAGLEAVADRAEDSMRPAISGAARPKRVKTRPILGGGSVSLPCLPQGG
jgi:hypothetical protein